MNFLLRGCLFSRNWFSGEGKQKHDDNGFVSGRLRYELQVIAPLRILFFRLTFSLITAYMLSIRLASVPVESVCENKFNLRMKVGLK